MIRTTVIDFRLHMCICLYEHHRGILNSKASIRKGWINKGWILKTTVLIAAINNKFSLALQIPKILLLLG